MSWKTTRLGDVATLKRGHDLPESARDEGDIPIISSSGRTGSHSEAKASGPGVITGRYGTIGQVYYVEEDYWPLNTALYVVDFKGNNPRFIAYLLENALRSFQSDKAAVPGVDRNVLHELKVRSTDVSTQEAVVAFLCAFDDLIENNRRRMVLLEDAARKLYREWFVRLRFPGHEHTRITDGVPSGWKRCVLANTCSSIEDGDWIESKDQGGEDYRLLQVSNIGVNEFVETNNFRYVSEETYRRLNCREVMPGQILISRMPKPIGRAWLVNQMPWRMITAVDVAIAAPAAQVADPYFLVYFLNLPSTIEQCERRAVGATRSRVSRKDVASLPLVLPPWKLQIRFREIVEPLSHQRANLYRQNEKLRTARDLLLPRLMSGEIAV